MVRFLRGVLSAAVALSLVNCGGGGGTNTPTTPAPTAPTVSSVTVTGPTSSATTGQTAQFTATAVMSNGTTQTVTDQSSWQSSNGSVATVSGSGLVTAVGAGDADVRATYQNVAGSARISVVSPSHSLCGTVRSSSTNATISAAELEILTGANAGRRVTADNAGAFCLNNLQQGGLTVRIRASGYSTSDQNLTVNGMTVVTFTLVPGPTPAPNPPSPGPTPPGPSPGPVNGICNAAAYPSSASCGTPSAVCDDNTLSCSQNRPGTCSSHGGVKCWLCPGRLCNGVTAPSLDASVPLPWETASSLKR